MPTLANLVIKDQAATPTDHTFKPRGSRDGVSTFVEAVGTPVGERRITCSRSSSANGRVRVPIKLAIPVVVTETINGVSSPKVARTSYADVTFNFDGLSTLQERKDLVAFVSNLTISTNTLMQSVLVDLEDFY